MSFPTERQLTLIAEIEQITGHPFEGDTKKEASQYIDENLDEFRLIQKVGESEKK